MAVSHPNLKNNMASKLPIPVTIHVYINDLPNCLSDSQPRMYADDTRLTYADNDICSIEASLNQDLSNIKRWLIAN